MSAYKRLLRTLESNPKIWLITGVAGFIGSNLLEHLLKLNQRVVGLDNFSTGHQHNLDEVRRLVSSKQWANFAFVRGDIRDLNDVEMFVMVLTMYSIKRRSGRCPAQLMIQ